MFSRRFEVPMKSFSRVSATRVFALAGAFLFISSASWAQIASSQPAAQKRKVQDSIPTEYRPATGMCRVWVDGVPAAQQPAPTDCPTATLKKPANSRVIYGEDPSKAKGVKTDPRLPTKGFTPPPLPIKKSPVDAAIPKQAQLAPRPREAWENKRITDEQLFGDRPAYSPASSYQGAYPGAQYPTGALYPAGQNSGGQYPGSVGTGAALGGNGILGDPRYFNNSAGVKPPGYGSGVCLDRDGDGWCDDLRFGPPVCLDQDKDGRCDDLPEFASQAYPQTLPHMRAALDVIKGNASIEVMRWLGTNEFIVRLPDQNSSVVPWRAIFLDSHNEVLQVWTDRNRDGLADRVEIFRNGQRVKLIQR